MTDTTIGTIKTLLSTAIDETADAEVSFKLRQAIQLLILVEEEHLELGEHLAVAELDVDVRQDLRELGYLD